MIWLPENKIQLTGITDSRVTKNVKNTLFLLCHGSNQTINNDIEASKKEFSVNKIDDKTYKIQDIDN